jgi:hypothetical protein
MTLARRSGRGTIPADAGEELRGKYLTMAEMVAIEDWGLSRRRPGRCKHDDQFAHARATVQTDHFRKEGTS